MAEKCLRNASCTCSLCTGFDVASLRSISKSIASTIQYGGEDDVEGQATAGDTTRVANPPTRPKAAPVASPVSTTHSDVSTRASSDAPDVVMVDVAAETAVEHTSPLARTTDDDVRMDAPGASMPLATAAADGSGHSASMSLEEVLPKLTDKLWKVRKEAFEALKELFEQPAVAANQVRAAVELFPKMCEDANASALEAAFAAVLAYTVHVEPFDKDIVPAVMTRVTDKGFSARPGIVKICEELTDAFVAAGAVEATTAALLEGVNNRKPKVPPACLSCLLEALQAYGPRVLPLQTIKAALPKLMEGPVKARPIAMNIMVEVYRWTGPALVQDIVANLRPAQKTEFEGHVKDVVPGQAAPTKFVKGSTPAKATANASGRSSSGAAEVNADTPAAFDPRDFAETVDLLAKLPKTEFKTKLALPKWSEKVEALKIVLEVIGPIPKLADGDFYELVTTLKALANDSNVNIVAKSIEVFGALADGLRKSFTQYARMVFPELLRKLSDKKSVILNAANTTLDLFLQHAMTLDMMLDDLKLACDASKNKSPPARVQTMAFVARAVTNRNIDLNDKAQIVSLGTMFLKGVEDSDPKAREAGQTSFIVLLQASDQAHKWLQSIVDEIVRKHPRAYKAIQRGLGGEAASTSSSRPDSTKSLRPSSASPSRPSSASSAANRSSLGDSKTSEDADAGVAGAATADPRSPAPKKRGLRAPLGMRAASAGGATAKTAPPKKSIATGSSVGASADKGVGTDFTPMAISISVEEAEDIIAELQLETWIAIKEGFASSKWMERKGAIDKLEEYAGAHSSMMSVRVIEAFTMYLAKQVKEFKDSNINVLKSSFEAVGTFAKTAAGKFPRGVVCLVTPRACDKIGDRKASEAVRSMILQFCEVTSPSYTLGCVIDHMPKVRLPLAHIEALSVLSDCVNDFGISLCNPRTLIGYAKGPQGLESSNPKVRSAAIGLLSVMYSQLGPPLLSILNLDTWKPALAETVKNEFKKTGYDSAKALASVKRHVKDHDESMSTAADSGALFGRVDVSSHFTKELFESMKNESDKGAWKKRGEAMDTVQAICEGAGCAIEFTRSVQEVLRSLRARLNDSNANMKVKAANVIAVVAASVGSDIAKMSKILGASLIAGVADNKKTMQSAAIQALHKWVCHNGKTSSSCMESLLPSLSEGLLNTVGRAELLKWAVEHLSKCAKLDLHCLVVPTVQCLMDKSSDAREKAQLLLVEVMKSVGKETVLTTGCRDIQPAAMRALKPLLAKVCELAEASGDANASHRSGLLSGPCTTPTQAPVSLVAAGQETNGPENVHGGTRRRASTSTGCVTPVKSRIARPGTSKIITTSSSATCENADTDAAPLLRMSTTKNARISKGLYNHWVFETTSISEMNARKSEINAEWKPFLSPDFHAKLFAPSLEKGMLSAMDGISSCIVHQAAEVIASLDLILKWCTLRIVDNNVQALAKLLEVLIKLFGMLKDRGYQLDDVEAAIFLPYLLQESGQSKPRFRVRFRDVMKLVVDVYSPEKYVSFLVECINSSKNMKSRCECVDLVEYIVSVHGYQVVGRKCIRDVGKYVVAHEKELRESAINALVSVYVRTDKENPDKFFRYAGITTQQGIDLLRARLRHLPASCIPPEAEAAPAAKSTSEQEGQRPQLAQRKGFGFGFGRASNAAAAAPAPSCGDSVQVSPAALSSISEVKHFSDDTGDGDVEMTVSNAEIAEETSPGAAIEELLLRPIEMLIDSSKEIVPAGTPAYKEGGNALKGLYAIINRPSDPSEVEFLHSYVNEIVLALCDCIHGSFYAGNAEKRPEMYILAISITTLTIVFNSEAVTSMQRYTVERVLLELCSKIMDPRLEKFSQNANLPVSELRLTPEENRYLMVYKALYKAMRKLTERAKPGDVYPSVINLLQRLMHNDVGEYNKNDTLKHLLKEDSLDQLVGRILLKLSNIQANALAPFEGIDIFGILMQMHGFFSTLPRAGVMMVDIANDNMQSALKIIAESLTKTRPGAFEASMKDIPSTSLVHQILQEMGYSQERQQFAAEPSGLHSEERDNCHASAAPHAMKDFDGATASGDPATTEAVRRSISVGNTGLAPRVPRTAFAAPPRVGSIPVATRGRSFTSFHDFAATRGAAGSAARPSTTSEQLENLRERLQMSRHFS
ncbi:unnamed protein product [Hyaloperonospora brassicae]|uniref:TOG domain-containing protein n=1 Tax=Hyaloperonospora brassicae TaxID=162125 RepID=A0AAV0TWT4_HYABA|nr:unnamed protein product [Hyaloperonospora brassicae]